MTAGAKGMKADAGRIDLRRSGRAGRASVRLRAYELFRQGARICDVCRELGVQRSTVNRWFRMFRAGDDSLLRGERSRRPAEPRRLLDPARLAELREAVVGQTPVEYRLPYKRWSYAAVAELVKAKFGLEVSRVTAGKWLAMFRKNGGSRRGTGPTGSVRGDAIAAPTAARRGTPDTGRDRRRGPNYILSQATLRAGSSVCGHARNRGT